ncbi:enoyl-CoA hydratase [Salinarchaeum sp. Harcht-Bsk1]|uniref:enoyl-CoA hydratase/isomerase family protein n=1 Tax=Salinarchaeum sp. Harcht-Bsk1 TaxID=1333523 RepID=UPI0003422837|nr:enoyl-CoA hydratase/isomerase family protein [Salinarchaeum sp. Harcht-Bsk1]AGN01082.1 enoyl-CoA hydratase [Salinarchaeum sp. Harcht-Bsk1]
MIRTGTRTVADGATIRTVTFDRPERRNALTPKGLDQLEAAVTDATEPVVLLRGDGDAFCAGADLDVVDALPDRDAAKAFAEHGQRVATAIAAADPLVVAGIDGAARGGGLELALACDLRIATPTATLGEPGVELGLFGAWGGTIRLREVCGLGDAMDLACSGRVLDAEDALRIGLVSRIVDGEQGIVEVAEELASVDPDALRTVKRRLRDDADRATQEASEAAAFADLVVARTDGGGR